MLGAPLIDLKFLTGPRRALQELQTGGALLTVELDGKKVYVKGYLFRSRPAEPGDPP